MKTSILGILLLLFTNLASADTWISAVPTSVRLVDGGLLILGDYDLAGISCATGPAGIFLSGSDTHFDQKLSMAQTAFALTKKIEVLIISPIADNCIAVSAFGNMPVAHSNYWYMK